MIRLFRIILAFCVTGGIAVIICWFAFEDLSTRLLAHAFGVPNVSWRDASPESLRVRTTALNPLWDSLLAKRTNALLIARKGQLLFERYAKGHGPNHQEDTAALAKALTGISALLICLQDGHLSLDDRLAKFVPDVDAQRYRIRIRDLAFHQSGLDDVDFFAAERGEVEGWKKYYYTHPKERFNYALRIVPMIFEPGMEMRYSGIGYYALAYVVTRSLSGSSTPDIYTLLRSRVMQPLHIPDAAWSISYGQSYEDDGMRLYAFGSGGTITPRAAARIGDWIRQGGTLNGRRLVDPGHVNAVLGKDEKPLVSTNHGWRLNVKHTWPSLPTDAFFGHGGGDQVVLVVPSLELVMVRFGAALSPDNADELDRELFAPLMKALAE